MARAELQRRSRTPSRGASPRMRSTSISGDSGDQWVLGGRDESAFYQAETQMLVRENQMLRHRVRDLGMRDSQPQQQLYLRFKANESLIVEKQLAELSPTSPTAHEPSLHSHLTHSTSVSEEEPQASATRAGASAPPPAAADTSKEE